MLFSKKYSNINKLFEIKHLQRCLSGLRSTIGNRVLQECNRRFKSSSLRQRKKTVFRPSFFFCSTDFEEDLRVGAVLQKQNTLPTHLSFTSNLTAKDAIDNGGAGRAAKGANPLPLTTPNLELSFIHQIYTN